MDRHQTPDPVGPDDASAQAPAPAPSHAPPQAAERNQLLRALPPAAYAALLPDLEPVELARGQALWRHDAPIRGVYFPRTAVTSLLTPLGDEAPVESATVGFEGLVGVPVVLGAESTHTHAVAQIPGTAARVDARRFGEWLRASDGATGLFLRYAQALLEQTAQSVACNRRHELEERCARWLLATRDRVGGDSFPLTHDFLAQMLGVRRATVTVAAGMLQQAGLVRYSRGRVTILDAAGLEAAACECYAVVRAQHARLVGPPAAA